MNPQEGKLRTKRDMVKVSIHKIVGSAIVLFGLFGCGKKIPSDVIQPDVMTDLLYDYHLASAMSSSLPYSENYKKEAYLQYVFQKHHVTEAEFDSSMVWYTRNSDELVTIYQDLQKRFENDEQNMKALVARRDNQLEVSMSGDTVDIWQDRTFYWLTASPLTNKVMFDLKADTSFKQRDALELVTDFHFLPKDTHSSVEKAIIGITYSFTNDSIQGITQRVLASGIKRLYLKPDSAYDIRNISGFIYYQGEKDLLVNNIQLIRYHEKELPLSIPGDTLRLDAKRPNL